MLDVEDPDGNKDGYDIKRCPICGILYKFKHTYEYLVYGSEDEEELRRQTPTQVRHLFTDLEYDELIKWMLTCVDHHSAMTRSYTARCLVSHYLDRNEIDQIAPFLKHPDPDLVLGALAFIALTIGERNKLRELWALHHIFAELALNLKEDTLKRASYITERLTEYAGGEENHKGTKDTKRN